jgi:hypothetical protein
MSDDTIHNSEWDERRKRLYKEALTEVLIDFGMDPKQPFELQQDMAWLRKRRKLEESTLVKAVGIIIGIVLSGIAGSIVYSMQRFFSGQ